MRILFVLEHFYPYTGGVEFLFYQLASRLAAEGHSVKVITTLYDDQLKRLDEVNGIQIQRIQCRNRFLFTLLSIPSIFKSAKHCDVIHTSTYNAAFPSWICAKVRRKKIVLTFHEYWGELWRILPFLKAYQRFGYRQYEKLVSRLGYHKVVAVSQATEESLINAGISKRKLRTIYNGLDYEEISTIRDSLLKQEPWDNNPYICFVGRLGVSKGFDLMFKAVDHFLEEHDDYHFKLVLPTYPDNMHQIVQKEMSQMSNISRVKVFRELSREELYQLIGGAKSILIPSYSEGFCFVAAESQALGTPIISSGNGALKEVVTGKHINMSEHSVLGLSKALEEMDKDNWQYGDGKIFPLSESVQAYVDLYRELVSE